MTDTPGDATRGRWTSGCGPVTSEKKLVAHRPRKQGVKIGPAGVKIASMDAAGQALPPYIDVMSPQLACRCTGEPVSATAPEGTG